MSAGEYHSRYALPCVQGEKRKRLEESIRKRAFLDESELREITPKAIQRIRDFAERIRQRDKYWTLEVVKRYWLKEHNRLIETKAEGFGDEHHTDATRQFCRVSLAEVLGVRGEGMNYKVRINFCGKERELESIIQPAVGERVTVHRGMVIEVLSSEDIAKYFPEK